VYYADASSRPHSVQNSALIRFDEMSNPNMPRSKKMSVAIAESVYGAFLAENSVQIHLVAAYSTTTAVATILPPLSFIIWMASKKPAMINSRSLAEISVPMITAFLP
jgi:hypothetical protein